MSKKKIKPTGILEKIRNTPDNEIRDDDHLQRKDITKAEFREALQEMAKLYKDDKPVMKKNNKIADATIKALNSLKVFLLFRF